MTLAEEELHMLRLLRDKGPQAYNVVAGPALQSLMSLRLVDWLGDERDVRGWRRVRISERGIARLEEETPGRVS